MRKTQGLFEKIYEENHRLVRNVIYNMGGGESLDDLTQEAFLKIWKGLPAFGFRSSLRTWVYRVSLNVAIDHLRRKKFEVDPWEDETSLPAPSPISLEGEKAERERTVQQAVMTLDEDHRAAVILHYFEALPIRKIAGILGVPEGTVKSRLHFAKKRMKDFFEKRGIFL